MHCAARQPRVEGEDHRCGSVAHAERAEDLPDVALHRHHRDDEFGGNLICWSGRAPDQLQYRPLAGGEPIQRGRAIAARRRLEDR